MPSKMDLLQEVKLSKKKILNSLKPYAARYKTFINDKDYKLKKTKEVVEMFVFLETL